MSSVACHVDGLTTSSVACHVDGLTTSSAPAHSILLADDDDAFRLRLARAFRERGFD